jgi:hypothetical protein
MPAFAGVGRKRHGSTNPREIIMAREARRISRG